MLCVRSYLRRDQFRRLDLDFRVPFSRRQDCHLVQELINACQQVISIFGMVGYGVKYLQQKVMLE